MEAGRAASRIRAAMHERIADARNTVDEVIATVA